MNEDEPLSEEVIEQELIAAELGSANEEYWLRELRKISEESAKAYQDAVDDVLDDCYLPTIINNDKN